MIIQNTGLTNQAVQAERNAGAQNGPSPVAVRTTTVQDGSPPSGVKVTATSQQLREAADTVNQALRNSSQTLQISVDAATNRSVYKLMDSKTGDIIRQIPSEEMLALAHSIDQYLERGQLLKEQA